MISTSVLPVAAAPLPDAAAVHNIGFKDWTLICSALGRGRQSLILRKGGIAEGREGFRFKHEKFYLFPTQYHQQAERVRPEERLGLGQVVAPPAGTIEIRYFFSLEWAHWVDDWSVIERLEPFHVWREDVVRERFEYDDQRGLQCAVGRVFRLEPAWGFADRPSYRGCRSWINLPEFPMAQPHSLVPVMDDARHETVTRDLRAILHFG